MFLSVKVQKYAHVLQVQTFLCFLFSQKSIAEVKSVSILVKTRNANTLLILI